MNIVIITINSDFHYSLILLEYGSHHIYSRKKGDDNMVLLPCGANESCDTIGFALHASYWLKSRGHQINRDNVPIFKENQISSITQNWNAMAQKVLDFFAQGHKEATICMGGDDVLMAIPPQNSEQKRFERVPKDCYAGNDGMTLIT